MPTPATLKEIAKAAGVHHTTVSMALRGKPGISKETRERIQAIAVRLGYVPNPVYSALTQLRLPGTTLAKAPKLAFLINCGRDESGRLPTMHRHAFEGAHAEGKRLGFAVELVEVGEIDLAPHALAAELEAKEYRGLILGALIPGHGGVLLDWTRWTAVKINTRHLEPGLPAVAHDHAFAVKTACDQMRRRGFKRLGLIVERGYEESVAHLNIAGYLLHQHFERSEESAPPLILPYSIGSDQVKKLCERWVERYQLDCVLTYSQDVLACACSLGPQVALVPLALSERITGQPGIFLDHHALGQRAAAALVNRLRLGNEARINSTVSLTLVEGAWLAPEMEHATP